MTDLRSLLDQFITPPPGGAGAAAQPGQSQQAGQGAGQGGGLDSLLSGKGGLVTGVAAGGLAGLLLGGKKPRKLAKSAVKLGGAALVGGLAYKAWQNWQANKQAQGAAPAPAAPTPASPAPAAALPSPQGTPFMPETAEAQEDLSRTLIRAMIAAAKADDHIDEAEKAKIFSQLEALTLADDDRQFIHEELSKPLDVAAVADAAKTPEQAAEIYAASLLVIDSEGAAERGYLAMLAARLNLEPELVQHLHASTAEVTQG